LSSRDRTAVAQPAELRFVDSRLGSQRVALGIDSLPLGEYVLAAQLRTGAGGRVGYALLESQGWLVAIVAALIGLGLGVFLALAVLLLGMIAQQRLSW
jgi:hypothetical protein